MYLSNAMKTFCSVFSLFWLFVSSGLLAKEQQTYACKNWKLLEIQNNFKTSKYSEKDWPFVLTIEQNHIKFRPGFVSRAAGTLPSVIFAELVARQDHKSDDPQRRLYLEKVANYPKLFQLIEYAAEPDQLIIRQVVHTGWDYYSVCKRGD